MRTEFFIGGQVAVTLDKQEKVANIQFLPDDDMALVLEQGSITRGQLQQLRNGAFDYVANKPRLRAKSTLLRKVAHGRLSATRDAAYQLTLKVFKREGVDVRVISLQRKTGSHPGWHACHWYSSSRLHPREAARYRQNSLTEKHRPLCFEGSV